MRYIYRNKHRITMDLQELRHFCTSMPHVTEDIKWEKDLCFLVSEKMFCVASLDDAFGFSFKTTPELFVELVEMPGIRPAPYMARHHWVMVEANAIMEKKVLETYLRDSYLLVAAKLPQKIRKKIGLDKWAP